MGKLNDIELKKLLKKIEPVMKDLLKIRNVFDLLYYLSKFGGISIIKIKEILNVTYTGARQISNRIKKMGLFFNPEFDDVEEYEGIIRILEDEGKIPRRYIIPTEKDLFILENGKTLSGYGLTPKILLNLDQFYGQLIEFMSASIKFSEFLSQIINQNRIKTI